ncbi:MAG TPA: Uma2 family endonuclease [Isosphaeraceae bacterium]|nr:Uma2 family endonuclease [Isosphaeraceae bacterium]
MATATASELEVLDPPTSTEPEGFYEVVDGQVREKAQMGSFETELAANLLALLHPFAQSNKLGRANMEMLYLLNRETKLQLRPDVAFVSAERWPLSRKAPRTAAWDVVPDLAVEIASPSNLINEDARKIEQYFQAGVKQVWLILPSVEKIHIYHSPKEIQVLGRGDTLEGGSVVPGFQVHLNDLFGEA